MLCPICQYSHSEVVRTTHDDNRNLILRRRECLKCGNRFTTNEKLRESKLIDERLSVGSK